MMNWINFFKLRGFAERIDMYATNFSIPKSLRKLMKEDMRKIEDKEYKNQSLNEFMLLLLATGGNYSYNTETKDWYRLRNYKNLENLYDLNEKEQQTLHTLYNENERLMQEQLKKFYKQVEERKKNERVKK
jgi:hypothetical protein